MSLIHPGLEAFIAVTHHGTVRGAADEVGLTQTGVTQRIRALERRLGTTLFSRSRRGMTLTPEGEALHRYCQRVRDLEGELAAFTQQGEAPTTLRLHVTGPSSIMRSRIIPEALKVRGRHPNVMFTFDLNDDESGLINLRNGRSQIAVVPLDEVVDELDSRRLRPARYILVGPRSWQRRPLREIVRSEAIVDFKEGDEATFRYLRKHRLHGLAHHERFFANNTDALASMVADGCGYTVLADDFARPLLESKQLVELNPGKDLSLEFALAWYPRHQMPGYFRDLVRGIK